MCTLVILRRPGHDWPLVLAANRDEMSRRPWRPPGRHWPDRADVTAGLDELAGGTWLGVNDFGVVAGVLNRPGSLGPEAGMRSRGELPLEALDHAEAAAAAAALAAVEAASYRAFNLFVADARDAHWLASEGGAAVRRAPVPDGLSMITAHDLNDAASARIRRYLPLFEAAAPPDPETGDWSAWRALLASRAPDPGSDPQAGPEAGAADDPGGAMTFLTEGGFGTVSSSLIAFPAPGRAGVKPVWLFAPGPPDKAAYGPVSL